MELKRIIIVSLIAVSLAAGIALAQTSDTPYGDFCPKCSKYGVCPKLLSVEESHEAVKSYFEGKGIVVGQISGHGRFLKIELVKEDKVIDVILFDRKTGRIRSIY